VILNYQHYRDFLINESLNHPSSLAINEASLIVRAAEKPSVVEWGNFVQRKQEQLKTRIYTNSILVMVLLVTLVALSYLEMYKIIPMIESLLHFPKKYQHRIKILIISGITSLINLLLSAIIQLLADSEKRLSKTGTTISLITKNVITQFINSALIYYLITFVTPASFMFQMKDLKRKV
jgi:membrane-associated HD superfamily phosphohydrolase